MQFFVTNNIERVSGMNFENHPNLRIISNNSPLAEVLLEKYPDRIILNTDDEFLSTLDLMKKFSDKIDSGSKIAVFKNTIHIQRFCEQNGWINVHADAEIGKMLEDKVSQHSWLVDNDFGSVIPKTYTGFVESFEFEDLGERLGLPFILQYNSGHTGSGTKLISNSDDWSMELRKFPKRDVKISRFIEGDTYTINACAMGDKIQCGKTSLQITGIPDLTDNPFSTVGNVWGEDSYWVHDKIKNMAQEIGKAMISIGWKGLFGIDVIKESKTGKLFLIEINARQTASASFENRLANLQKASGPLDWLMRSLFDSDCDFPVGETYYNASQLSVRKKSGKFHEKYGDFDKVGEWDDELGAFEETPTFSLPPQSNKVFVIPKATASEIIRIQSRKPLIWH